MLDFPRWKVLTISIGIALMVLLSVPSFVPKSVRETWPSWIPQPATSPNSSAMSASASA